MFVYKCDLCLKEIEHGANYIEIRNNRPYASFTFCDDHDCGGPLVNFLQLKELISIWAEKELTES